MFASRGAHRRLKISMVPDDVAAHEIVFGREQPLLEGLASGLKAGAIHLSMSTISAATSSEIAAEPGTWCSISRNAQC
jgi:3-hydroxyisobutyrate dehydrogenase-like beta-hydroxyacid dehydrogenase